MIKFMFKEDTLTARQPAKYKLDPAKKPKTIDVLPTDGLDKDKTIEGIYEIKGEELTVCVAKPGSPRPTEFASKAGSGHVLFVLKKAKPEK